MKMLIELCVNGDSYEVAVEPQTTLAECLREHLGLTGTKEACGTGECGSCTVLADSRPIVSCLVLAADCQGMEITTIEGLAPKGVLTALQEEFVKRGAVQCGFCTPGMILSSAALLKETSTPTDAKIRKALEGNLCRCTGYNKIIEAVRGAAERLSGERDGEAGQ
ncbi:MAG: (2Fe-2S)-binding protein [Deltaproteobacteria bacterium]